MLCCLADIVEQRCESTTMKPVRQQPAVNVPHSGVRVLSRPSDTYRPYSHLQSSANTHRLNVAIVLILSTLYSFLS